jgi:hypothetical protein
LRFVFEPVAVTKLPVSMLGRSSDSAAIVRAVLESETAYARGARSLGLPERLPEQVLNQLGYGVLQVLKKPDLAVWTFRRNVALYPESPNVHDSLSDALIATGDTAAARTELRRAVEIATRTNHPVLSESRRKLQQLEQTSAPAGKSKTK